MTFADAAILICDGHAGMIDAGGYAEESAVQTALEALGVTRLDWVVATHPHHDHQPGFEAIARRMPIGRFLTSFPANENAQMQHTLAVMADCGVPIENALLRCPECHDKFFCYHRIDLMLLTKSRPGRCLIILTHTFVRKMPDWQQTIPTAL